MTDEHKQLKTFMPGTIHDVEIEILERCQYGKPGAIRRLFMTEDHYKKIDSSVRVLKHTIIE